MTQSGRAVLGCLLEFVKSLEEQANLRPSEIALDDRVFDVLAEGVLSMSLVEVSELKLAPQARFSLRGSVVPRCYCLILLGVKVVRHSENSHAR